MHRIIAVAILGILLASSCSKDQLTSSELSPTEGAMAKNAIMGIPSEVQQGKVIIKVSTDAATNVKLSGNSQIQLSALPSALDRGLKQIKAYRVQRLFPHAGKFEERTVREGLNRWLVVEFDKSISVGEAMVSLSSVPGVSVVEYVPKVEPTAVASGFDFSKLGFKRGSTMPFNDPDLKNQWHYNNDGTFAPGSVVGADINLFKAWQITKGTSNVIVCVVDGGVDVNHPDLKDNIWINEKEKNGAPGVDDDHNGYIDDVNGYCFVVKSSEIRPDADAHGTHVAGTVAARNNNGIGVCGVAGGDGTPGSGVRIMSAAIFREGANFDGDGAAAIKYGADNGAVISQNSWTYPPGTGIKTLPQSLKEAIDYFVKYAGCDNDGNQLPGSPMKGGIVFFAAGNYNLEYEAQPASYENVIAVTAMGTNFEKASYSNYGAWADIMAPGGDQDRYFNDHAGVLSTVAPSAGKTSGKSYDYYQGTSMACPHVSGIAALVLSHKGGMGYTNEMLKQQILASVYPVDINEVNPFYSGKLGVGFIDAYAALTIENKNLAPQKPIFDETKSNSAVGFTESDLYWTVPADKDDGSPMYFRLYYSEKPLDNSNYKQATPVGNINNQIPCMGRQAGDLIDFKISGLKSGTKYYYALVAVDRWGLSSDVAFYSNTTKKNDPPMITNLPEKTINILSSEKWEYTFEIKDPNGHKWNYELLGDLTGFSHTRNGEAIDVKIRPAQPEGEYSFTIKLVDELNTSAEYLVKYRIISVKAPVLRTQIPAQLIGVQNKPVNLNLSDYFEPHEFLTYSYTVNVLDQSVANATLDPSGKVVIKGLKPGKTIVFVEVSNGYKKTSTSFEVTVVDDVNKDVYSVWPLPIRKDVNVWVNSKYKSASIKLLTVHGEVVFSENVPVNSSGIATVDMRKVAPGSYTLLVKVGTSTFSKAVLKR